MKILFCSDGSSQSTRAIRFGAQIAVACQAESTIIGVTERPEDKDELSKELQNSLDILKGYDLDAEVIIRVGNPEREIVKHTLENEYDLVVIGAECKNAFRRLLDPWWVSVRAYRVHKIIETVAPPVLAVFCERPEIRRILLCTNADAYFDEAIQYTSQIARCLNAVVNLFHVMPEPPAMYVELIRLEYDSHRVLESNTRLGQALRHQKELLEEFGVFGEVRLRHGAVIPELLKELKRAEYDLVVSGTPVSEANPHRYVMGDVTRQIVLRAELPVLMIRTGRGQIMRFIKKFAATLFRRFRSSSEESHNDSQNRKYEPDDREKRA